MAMPQSDNDDHDDRRDRANLIVLVVALVLIAAGYLLVHIQASHLHTERCLEERRLDCSSQ